jgi:hypothetical protein
LELSAPDRIATTTADARDASYVLWRTFRTSLGPPPPRPGIDRSTKHVELQL